MIFSMNSTHFQLMNSLTFKIANYDYYIVLQTYLVAQGLFQNNNVYKCNVKGGLERLLFFDDLIKRCSFENARRQSLI